MKNVCVLPSRDSCRCSNRRIASSSALPRDLFRCFKLGTPVMRCKPSSMACALSAPISLFRVVSTGCRNLLLNATARKIEMMKAEMQTIDILLARLRTTPRAFESQPLSLGDIRIVMTCCHRDIQSWPVEELFMPKKEVKNPSGVSKSTC